MTDKPITIMAKAILDDDLHEIAMPQRCVAIAAVAILALRAAGYLVERWRPIEEAPKDGGYIPLAINYGGQMWVYMGCRVAPLGHGDGWWEDEDGGIVYPAYFTTLPPASP